MSFIDEVRTKRRKLADVLADDDYSGIREIVEELYPDKAHFIYELLQNAEDVGAEEAVFTLHDDSLIFEHDGTPFTEENVWGITNIGKGTKRGDEDQIGRFGVGFKAVFAYTETPRIWSPTFCFEISNLVLPAEIPAAPDPSEKTRFEFPFNNPKKSPQEAHAEVLAGLNELAGTTLLFLSHLKSIRWQVGKFMGEVRCVSHTKNHIEVLKLTTGEITSASHFLRFDRQVCGMEKQRVAVAFALDHLPNVTAFDPKLPLTKQLRIVSANPGRVAVFFPAEKETSELRFHLHAPFVPALDRASIKDTTVNEPLFLQLANLSASALHEIRTLDLLTGEFLAVLPNSQDSIPPRYEPIRAAIIAEMNNEPLTPTQAKSHAPAKHLLQGKAALKELLSTEDIEHLVEYEEAPPQWAISAAQKNSNADRFLLGLDIRNWDVDEFAEHLEQVATEGGWRTPDEQFTTWLAAKPVEWHQQFYAFLYHEFNESEDWKRFESLKIVRLSDGTYSIGRNAYFPTEAVKQDELFTRVAESVYSSGKRKPQQEASRKLLEAIGVREVGEAEEVQAILDQRYTATSCKPVLKDLKRFIALVEKEPARSNVFAKYHIFERADGKWGTPGQVFLDSPYLETGLSVYYEALGRDASRAALAEKYQQCGIALDKIRNFLEALGVQKQLEIVKVDCYQNPQWSYLYSVPGERNTSPINRDFIIPGLAKILARQTIPLSRLVWQTMCSLPRYSQYLQSCYRKNEANGAYYADSQLVHILRDCAWVPQKGRGFVKPFEADGNLLPEGFPYDSGNEWLVSVKFGEYCRPFDEDDGENEDEEAKKNEIAKELGFIDPNALERAQKFTALPQEDQVRFLADFERRQNVRFPEHESSNPSRRSQLVEEQAAIAPKRLVEQRTRSVSVGREAVKTETEKYLRAQYTNKEGELFCQICKEPMPFKLSDDSFYFEMVEFLDSLRLRHYQNYLALCPNHAAMFEHANGSKGHMRKMFLDLESLELEVVLAQKKMTVQFTRTHIEDLKRVIGVDNQNPA